ncbi:hypothetical protein D3C83_289400 [compost metagenome]
MRISLGQTEVVANARSAKQLNGHVGDFAQHVGRGHFDHCNFLRGDLVAHGVHHVRGV